MQAEETAETKALRLEPGQCVGVESKPALAGGRRKTKPARNGTRAFRLTTCVLHLEGRRETRLAEEIGCPPILPVTPAHRHPNTADRQLSSARGLCSIPGPTATLDLHSKWVCLCCILAEPREINCCARKQICASTGAQSSLILSFLHREPGSAPSIANIPSSKNIPGAG